MYIRTDFWAVYEDEAKKRGMTVREVINYFIKVGCEDGKRRARIIVSTTYFFHRGPQTRAGKYRTFMNLIMLGDSPVSSLPCAERQNMDRRCCPSPDAKP